MFRYSTKGHLLRKAEWGSVNRRGAAQLDTWGQDFYIFGYLHIMLGKVRHHTSVFPQTSLDRRRHIAAVV